MLHLIILKYSVLGGNDDGFKHTNPVLVDGPTVLVSNDILVAEGLGGDILAANNNVAAALYNGRLFMAWRSAPTHFASEEYFLVFKYIPRRRDVCNYPSVVYLQNSYFCGFVRRYGPNMDGRKSHRCF